MEDNWWLQHTIIDMLFADWYIYFRHWHLETFRKLRLRDRKKVKILEPFPLSLDFMQYKNLEEKNEALNTWCSVLFLRHLIRTFFSVSYFQSCSEESCLPKEYQKVKYYCLLCNHKEVTLGRTLEWAFCGQHVCGHSKPLWMQNLCLICWASPSVISFLYLLFSLV